MNHSLANAVDSAAGIPGDPVSPAAGGSPVAAPTLVMLAVPRVPSENSSADFSGIDRVVPADIVENKSSPSRTVPLIEPDASPLQNFVQNGRQGFLSLVGGSRFWRLFVGGGFAVLVGSITLIVLEPRPQAAAPSGSKPAESKVTAPLARDSAVADSAESGRSEVQLVVNETTGPAGQQSAQYMDPFVEENLVGSGVEHALHQSDAATDRASRKVRQVADQHELESGPAWLSGTIE